MVDVDGLKRVNDCFGHAAGDQLLRAASDALLRAAGSGATVARFGGDEFAVLAHVPDRRAAEAFRDRLQQSLRHDVVVFGNAVEMRASVGLAATADPTTRGADLIHAADQDMYRRKRQRV
ncbi:hypothetical protein GCM10011581_33890 [Saccharopolyspora subtropica]|uniref:GGDEF domain-containing protein n=1 Tax=Saccharopolyspora thermophila TaxID=89367 RepID=A0A917K1U0_9PSEU|nr:GGDEF domain-containing protein [Saccharopolyspora subtropica]GGI93974.1 hypothetical protein GCM10011581_33890 [Saccharopolyspora subtropica]